MSYDTVISHIYYELQKLGNVLGYYDNLNVIRVSMESVNK